MPNMAERLLNIGTESGGKIPVHEFVGFYRLVRVIGTAPYTEANFLDFFDIEPTDTTWLAFKSKVDAATDEVEYLRRAQEMFFLAERQKVSRFNSVTNFVQDLDAYTAGV